MQNNRTYAQQKKGVGIYHRHRSSSCLLKRQLYAEMRCVFLGMLEIELIETSHSCEENTLVKLVHMTARLEYDGWIGRFILLLRCEGARSNFPLRQVRKLDSRPRSLCLCGSLEMSSRGERQGKRSS